MAAQIPDLPDKLRGFAIRVEQEVKRPLLISSEADPNSSNFKTYANANNKTHMEVVIDPTVTGLPREQSIAHEMIHWLLWARRFKVASFSKEIRKSQFDMISALVTAIDDIAVHNIQDLEGFGSFNVRFRRKLEIELGHINLSRRPYLELSGVPLVAGTYVSCSYAMAWSSINFHELDTDMEGFLQKYMRAVEQQLPEDYTRARALVDAVDKHGVFEPVGHSNAFTDVLGEWGLAGLCEHSILGHLFS